MDFRTLQPGAEQVCRLVFLIAVALCQPAVALAQPPLDQDVWLFEELYAELKFRPIGSIATEIQPPQLINIGETSQPGRAPIDPHLRSELSDDARAAAGAVNGFTFDVFDQIRSKRSSGENVLISPLSISSALAMTYAGAAGRTAEQMADVLHFSDFPSAELHAGYGELLADLNTEREGYQLKVANRLFGQQGFDFKQPYVEQLERDYAAPLERLDFAGATEESRVYINQWVEEQTNDRIKDLLPRGSIERLTRLVLTNAVYFDGDWKHAFRESATRDAQFHLDGQGVVDVPTMFQQEKFRYGQFDNFQMLEMPYAGDDLSMVIMLPNELDGLAPLETSLTSELFEESVKSLRNQEVQVHLPSFTFKDEENLGEVLQDLGMTDAFSELADFSGMANEHLEISGVFHKTFIEVNESGTEAAAATAVVIRGVTVAYHPYMPPPVFRADHPFLFALRDTHSGSLLFLGRMADPGGSLASVAGVETVPEPGSVGLMLFGIFGGLFLRASSRRPRLAVL